MIRALRLLPLLLLSLAAAPARALPPVWVVHGPHATILLFGSVHLLPPNLQWEPRQLKEALTKADDLWFEIPIEPAANLAAGQMAARLGILPPGQSLLAQLSPADRLRLARAANVCGLPLEGLDRLRPWYADITLSVASIRLDGAGAEGGVEQTLSAANPNAPRRAFETVEDQIGFLSGGTQADQVASLEETMSEVEEGPAAYQRLLRAWMTSDTAALQREALKPLMKQAPGVYRALVVERNQRWLKKIVERLNGQGEAVMVVGVGHLIGADSVPALLRRQGVRVEGP